MTNALSLLNKGKSSPGSSTFSFSNLQPRKTSDSQNASETSSNKLTESSFLRKVMNLYREIYPKEKRTLSLSGDHLKKNRTKKGDVADNQ